MSELDLVRDLAGTLSPEAGWLLMVIRSWNGEAVPSLKELARLTQMRPTQVLSALGALGRMGLLTDTILSIPAVERS
jgi:predicted transcriptional regulator